MTDQALRSVLIGTLIAWGVIELAVFIRGRLQSPTREGDRLSAPLFVVAVFLGISLANRAARNGLLPLPGPRSVYLVVGIALVFCGIAIRAWSFASLGRLFTFYVTIQPGHHVVTSGPYRYARHPSYTGAFLILAGYILELRDAVGLLAALAALGAVTAYRISVEERELTTALGDEYRAYARHTKRLIPGVL